MIFGVRRITVSAFCFIKKKNLLDLYPVQCGNCVCNNSDLCAKKVQKADKGEYLADSGGVISREVGSHLPFVKLSGSVPRAIFEPRS